jgi:arsenate reductase
MAEAFLKSFDASLQVFSAGTKPAPRVHPKAVAAMRELGIDISGAFPKNVEEFIEHRFDFVITVCDDARETCPVFVGNVKNRLHMGFDDPAIATGTDAEVMTVFRRVRDEIQQQFTALYFEQIKPLLTT